jgi:hypothetical protein
MEKMFQWDVKSSVTEKQSESVSSTVGKQFKVKNIVNTS